METKIERKRRLTRVTTARVRAKKAAAWKRLGLGAAEFAGIINGMNADQLAMFIAGLADAKADGGK